MGQYGTSYKRGTLFFPHSLRKKVYVVYAYVRAADQIVDTPWVSKSVAEKELSAMQQKTARARSWKDVDDALILWFVTVAKEHNFAREWIEAFFDAMRMDTAVTVYTTYAQLQQYMYGSAEVIWLMMTELIGYTWEKKHVYASAKKLGEAMQYTNFLRDVFEDRQDHQRIYMPLERLFLHELTGDDIKKFCQEKKGDARWLSFCQQEITFAQGLYTEAIPWIAYLDRQWRFAVRVAAMLYAGILWKIEQVWYDQFASDAHTTRREKCRLFLWACTTYFFPKKETLPI